MKCLSAALKMGTTLAILSSSGKMPSFIKEFIRCARGFINIFIFCFKIRAGTSSYSQHYYSLNS